MTIRQFYDNLLSELNKVEAPSILLEDFIYFANKAVQQYVNKVYTRYDISQQSTDDLRALKVTKQIDIYKDDSWTLPSEDAHWYSHLPEDYLHLLNCVVVFRMESKDSDDKCSIKQAKKVIKSVARRLTSDLYPNVLNNAYFKPSYKCPYYFITATKAGSSSAEVSINAQLNQILNPCYTIEDSADEFLKLEIRCGSNDKYYPSSVYVDYIRTPKVITITYDDLEPEFDHTESLEFPEYVCYEILNECVKLVMENASDPRLQTNIPVNQTIGNSVQQN